MLDQPHAAPRSSNRVFWSALSERLLPYDITSLENRDEELIENLTRYFGSLANRYFNFTPTGFGRIPEGPGLYVGNHNGGVLTPDTFLFSTQILKEKGIDEIPFALTHELPMQLPLFHHFAARIGCLRAGHDTAAKAFEAGNKVLVYPGGDEDAFRPYRDRNRLKFGGRQGYMRLALREGVPIIPVVTVGAHQTFVVLEDLKWLAQLIRAPRLFRIKVCPLILSVPWGLTLGFPPPHLPLPSPIHMEVLKPLHFERSGPEAAEDTDYVTACTNEVEDAMQKAITRLAQERKEAHPFLRR